MHRFAWICDPETGYSGCVPLKAGFSLMSKSSMDSWGCGIKKHNGLNGLNGNQTQTQRLSSDLRRTEVSKKDAAKAPNEAARIVKNVQAEPRILEAPFYDDSFGLISLITFSISVKSQDI